MSEAQEAPSALSCPDEPARVAAVSVDDVAQAPDKKGEVPKVSHDDSEEQKREAEKRRRNTLSAIKSRFKRRLLPNEVIDSMRDRPSGLFFLDNSPFLVSMSTDHNLVTYGDYGDYENKFDCLWNAVHTLKTNAAAENRDFHYFSQGYSYPKDDEGERLPTSSMKVMAAQLGYKLSLGVHKWHNSSGVARPVEEGHSNFGAYTELVLTELGNFFQKNSTTELLIVFDELLGIQEDKEELQKMLELLRALCTYMISSGSRLKVAVMHNIFNKLWERFYQYTSAPEDAGIRSLCTAHKFVDGDCWLLWPEHKKASIVKRGLSVSLPS